MTDRLKLRLWLLSGSACLAGAMTTAAPAQAQDEGASAQEQAIVITGSRIARRDYQANSPIVTVDSDILETSSSSAIESNLNKLPQFTPAQTP